MFLLYREKIENFCILKKYFHQNALKRFARYTTETKQNVALHSFFHHFQHFYYLNNFSNTRSMGSLIFGI